MKELPLLTKLRHAKRIGMSRAEAEKVLFGSAKVAAKRLHWDGDKLATVLESYELAVDSVYGVKP
jgi:hypothetical protein